MCHSWASSSHALQKSRNLTLAICVLQHSIPWRKRFSTWNNFVREINFYFYTFSGFGLHLSIKLTSDRWAGGSIHTYRNFACCQHWAGQERKAWMVRHPVEKMHEEPTWEWNGWHQLYFRECRLLHSETTWSLYMSENNSGILPHMHDKQ